MIEDLPKEILEQLRKSCDHKCHTQGLNNWIEYCLVCSCPNLGFDENAKPPF